jgi:hypothetical protein
LLVQLYAEERKLAESGQIPRDRAIPEDDVARVILENNLHGIDIDPRAVQLSSLALYLKAKEIGLSRSPRINVVPADASFLSGEAWNDFINGFEREPSVRRVLESLAKSLENIRELGTLLQPEIELRRIVAEEHKQWEQQVKRGVERPYLFAELEDESRQGELPFEQITDEMFWERLSHRAETAIQSYVQQSRERGEVVDQVVAGEAQRGFAFLELCQQRYDVVCTNPPYMGSKNMGLVLKDFVTKHYAPGKRDLYSAFILRCRELARVDGHVAMVTQQSWMFLRSFADLRALPKEKLKKSKNAFTGLLRETSIETIAHLGPGAFAEISGEVVNIALFTLSNTLPSSMHKIMAFRQVKLSPGQSRSEALSKRIASLYADSWNGIAQMLLLDIPGAPLVFWLTPHLISLLKSTYTLADWIDVRGGLSTTDNNRFLRFHWECQDSCRWIPYTKGGGYSRWKGSDYYNVDWQDDGAEMKAYIMTIPGNTHWSRRIFNSEFYFRKGFTYSLIANGCLGVRWINESYILGHKGPGIFATADKPSTIGGILNSRLITFLLRAIAPQSGFETGHLLSLPRPETDPSSLFHHLVEQCIKLKDWIIRVDPSERHFSDVEFPFRPFRFSHVDSDLLTLWLLIYETFCEKETCLSYGIDTDDLELILGETGIPAAYYPRLQGYEKICGTPMPLSSVPQEVIDSLDSQVCLSLAQEKVGKIKERLRNLYGVGPGMKVEEDTENQIIKESETDDEEDAPIIGSRTPIPAETFLEELSQKLETHPISVYLLLEELRSEGNLICPPQLKRQTEDYFTVKILRMLGHRWPMQDQYEKEQGKTFINAKWIDEDGIVPLTSDTGEETLIERFSRFLDEEFGSEHGHSVEVEAGKILGWKPSDKWGNQRPMTLARWFEREFFKRHVSQFKKRPIAWHLTSAKGTFQTIVYYHMFDKNRLTLLRARYVREVLETLRKQLGEAQKAGTDRAALAKVAELEIKVGDVQEFDARLNSLLEGRDREARIWCPWKKPEEQPFGWDPDINDGVRVNIAPVQRLGLLAADVLAAKDLKSLLAPEGRN